MPVQRTFEPDLQKQEVCGFLMQPGSTIYNSDEQSNTTARQSEGYTFAHKRSVSGSSPNINKLTLRTYVVSKFELYTQANRLIQTPAIVDPVDHRLDLEIIALLYVKNVDQATQKSITDAFDTTDLNDVSQAEATLIKSGIDIDAYQIDLVMQLNRLAAPEILYINRKVFLDQIQALTDKSGKPLYHVRFTDLISTQCTAPNYELPSIPGDVENPDSAIADAEKGRPCDGLAVTSHRIGTAFQYYEWKTEWQVRPIKVGRCMIMKTKIPIFYSRIRKQALWGYVISEQELKRFLEKAFLQCLEEAAIETAVLAIVTGGLGFAAAVAAFGAACQTCIEAKVSDVIKCLFSGLKIVAETDDWQEKVF